MFDVPRGTKMPHREQRAVPEFHADAKPVLRFTFGNEIDEVFNPRNVGGEGCRGGVESQEKSLDKNVGSAFTSSSCSLMLSRGDPVSY